MIKKLYSIYHFLLSFLGAILYRFPSKGIRVIGVTGTNGKTTTVHIISEILKKEGYRVASTSSVKFEVNNKKKDNLLKMTMPGRFALQRFLREAVDAGCSYAVLEVSSEGIEQHRHRFINFHTAVMTNLSKEHIESHGSFENYKKAKGKLFRETKRRHVINLDDKHKDYFLSFPAKEKIYYSLKSRSAQVFAEKVQSTSQGVSFVINGEDVFVPLKGSFNVYNVLAAVAAVFPKRSVKKPLSEMGVVPGRMEEVISSPFRVIVDYAVTPESLELVYKAVRRDFSPRRVICVFGACGGGRDKWKRPVMGEVASKNCDKIIVTSEDPYDEDPRSIVEQTAPSGADKVIDRQEAIEKAISQAQEGDVIVITGKGSEPWMCLARGEKIPWDDRKIAKEFFDKMPRKK